MTGIFETLASIAAVVAFLVFIFGVPMLGRAAAAKWLPEGLFKRLLLKDLQAEAAHKPTSARIECRNLALWLAFMLLLFGIAFVDDARHGRPTLSLSFGVAYSIGIAWLVLSLWAWHRASPAPMSPAERDAFRKRLHGHWLSRYTIAAVLLCGVAALMDYRPNLWWLFIALVVWAAILAREISILVLALAGAYLLFLGVAALPTSIAIIIGALIIAAALRKKGHG